MFYQAMQAKSKPGFTYSMEVAPKKRNLMRKKKKIKQQQQKNPPIGTGPRHTGKLGENQSHNEHSLLRATPDTPCEGGTETEAHENKALDVLREPAFMLLQGSRFRDPR